MFHLINVSKILGVFFGSFFRGRGWCFGFFVFVFSVLGQGYFYFHFLGKTNAFNLQQFLFKIKDSLKLMQVCL